MIGIVVVLLALGLGLVELIALPFGGIEVGQGLVLGAILAAAVLGVLALFGRRRQKKMQAERAARAPGSPRSALIVIELVTTGSSGWSVGPVGTALIA